MKIIGTGLSGLVGSRIIELLSPEFIFENLSLETGVDITNETVLKEKIIQSDASWVFHFAAKTDVDGCENDKALGDKGMAWIINSIATRNIAEICALTSKHLLYISTDMVFDGTKNEYNELDQPNPISWYGETKYQGEKSVLKLKENGLVIRIANPYRTRGPGKPDFVHKIIDRLIGKLPIAAPNDQIFTPTYIDDIASAIKFLVINNHHGLFHVVGNDSLSPYAAFKTIANIYNLDDSLIAPTTLNEYFKNKAPRPLHACLKNVKITRYGILMSDFKNGVTSVKKQEELKI
jgi:dTDP-4-dehydrorhamnose reductase